MHQVRLIFLAIIRGDPDLYKSEVENSLCKYAVWSLRIDTPKRLSPITFCQILEVIHFAFNQGFFKQATMGLWAVETTKWAVVYLKFGQLKINSLRN